MECPNCKQPMKEIGPNHTHCQCGVCVWNNMLLVWHQPSEKQAELCTWRKDPYIKTSGLA